MEIEIVEPVFKCKNDEEVFFQRLSKISGFQEVVKINRRLHVSVFEGDHQHVLDQIQNICTLWHTSFETGY